MGVSCLCRGWCEVLLLGDVLLVIDDFQHHGKLAVGTSGFQGFPFKMIQYAGDTTVNMVYGCDDSPIHQ